MPAFHWPAHRMELCVRHAEESYLFWLQSTREWVCRKTVGSWGYWLLFSPPHPSSWIALWPMAGAVSRCCDFQCQSLPKQQTLRQQKKPDKAWHKRRNKHETAAYRKKEERKAPSPTSFYFTTHSVSAFSGFLVCCSTAWLTWVGMTHTTQIRWAQDMYWLSYCIRAFIWECSFVQWSSR